MSIINNFTLILNSSILLTFANFHTKKYIGKLWFITFWQTDILNWSFFFFFKFKNLCPLSVHCIYFILFLSERFFLVWADCAPNSFSIYLLFVNKISVSNLWFVKRGTKQDLEFGALIQFKYIYILTWKEKKTATGKSKKCSITKGSIAQQ